MSRRRYSLSVETAAALDLLRDRLDSERSTLAAVWDDMSERWQESERGQAVSEWLSALETVVDAVEDAETEPTS